MYPCLSCQPALFCGHGTNLRSQPLFALPIFCGHGLTCETSYNGRAQKVRNGTTEGYQMRQIILHMAMSPTRAPIITCKVGTRSLVPSLSHSSFYLAAVEKKRGEGLVPLIICRDVCTRRVDLHAHAKGLICQHTN